MRWCKRRRARASKLPWVGLGCVLLPLCLLVPPLLLYACAPLSPPSTFSSLPLSPSSSSSSSCSPSLCLLPSNFCSFSCHAHCFPRILGLCFYPSQVQICKDSVPKRQAKDLNTSKACRSHGNKPWDAPSFMRFHGERLTLPVVHSSLCMGHNKKWISGLSMVADQRYLPYGKPNPHHEAEKLIPALLMHQKLKGSINTTLYWFSSRNELSQWAIGFMNATGMDSIVHFLELPKEDEAAVCFEDAVTFSAPTNLWYIPDERWNLWLRRKVLHHCSIPAANASWPLKTAAILDRTGARHFANKQLVAEAVHRVLNISVKQGFGGIGTFCDQVQAVVAEDLLIVPHGSQNTNLIFARPGTVVIEVFPYLYYTNALRNLTHAAGLQVYAVLGKHSQKNVLMRIFSLVGWDVCYSFRWCKNYARRQPITVDIQELEKILCHIGLGHLQPLATST